MPFPESRLTLRRVESNPIVADVNRKFRWPPFDIERNRRGPRVLCSIGEELAAQREDDLVGDTGGPRVDRQRHIKSSPPRLFVGQAR
ncbi:MAG: hypothetical protein QOD76_259 [Solirubrobacteraceae bacterium]|nr:hypothetical protein [Solirubrobacteraceae bacterium]